VVKVIIIKEFIRFIIGDVNWFEFIKVIKDSVIKFILIIVKGRIHFKLIIDLFIVVDVVERSLRLKIVFISFFFFYIFLLLFFSLSCFIFITL
jgi:hypothetical protein